MPRKVRQLMADLRRAEFIRVPGGKGSHQKWQHPETGVLVIVSGAEGADAKPYQERQVTEAIRESREQASSPFPFRQCIGERIHP